MTTTTLEDIEQLMATEVAPVFQHKTSSNKVRQNQIYELPNGTWKWELSVRSFDGASVRVDNVASTIGEALAAMKRYYWALNIKDKTTIAVTRISK